VRTSLVSDCNEGGSGVFDATTRISSAEICVLAGSRATAWMPVFEPNA